MTRYIHEAQNTSGCRNRLSKATICLIGNGAEEEAEQYLVRYWPDPKNAQITHGQLLAPEGGALRAAVSLGGYVHIPP